jgi:hypothetical protein
VTFGAVALSRLGVSIAQTVAFCVVLGLLGVSAANGVAFGVALSRLGVRPISSAVALYVFQVGLHLRCCSDVVSSFVACADVAVAWTPV